MISFRTETAAIAAIAFVFCSCAFSAEPVIEANELPRIAATEPVEAAKTFRVKPGFRIELVAAEPLVMDPIAMSFDENGRLFVVEMRDYSERRDERLGRVRVLEDTDGDGRFDKSTVFARDLPWPTAVICYDGGAFIGASPEIYYCKDTNGDGIADTREVVFTGFAAGADRLNVQALLNSFTWGLDNRIHGATSLNGGKVRSPRHLDRPAVELRGRDFSFDPRTLELRPESGGAQHGLSFDNAGRKFVCSNSAHIQMLMYEDGVTGRSPYYTMPSPLVNIAEDGPAAEVYRISPDEPWRVVRTKWRVAGLVPGPIEGGGRASGYFTGATGVTIYRGNAWPEEYHGDAFIADCGSNLIHRKKLFPNGAGFTARRPGDELKIEFIASTDNWFRPVQFANAPDGNLYVADMYREVIEHPWSLPGPIKKHLDLNSGNDRGRIYRIVREGFRQPELPRLRELRTADLVKTLEHSNGWHRDTAARLLFERRDRAALPALDQLIENSPAPLGRLHALYALESMGALSEAQLAGRMTDTDERVREHAVRLSRRFVGGSATTNHLRRELAGRLADPAPRVRYQLAFIAGEISGPERRQILETLAKRDYADPWMRAAILNSIGAEADYAFFAAFMHNAGGALDAAKDEGSQHFVAELLGVVAMQKKPAEISRVVAYLAGLKSPMRQRVLARSLLDGLRRGGMPTSTLEEAARSQLKAIQSDAVRAALDENESEVQRVPAIQLLGALDWPEAGEVLGNLLGANQPFAVQQSSVSALTRFKEPQAAKALLVQWAQLAPRARSEALAALLSRTAQLALLLDAVERQTVKRSEFSTAQIAFLRSHRDAGIRGRAVALFGANEAGNREEIVQQFRSALSLPGVAARGARIYAERCSSCHKLGREGYDVGPDLASVRANGKEKLLVSILDPNREVSPSYLNYEVETRNGETVMGLIAAESGAGLTLKRAYGDQTIVARSEIRRIQSLSQSVMPEGLEDGLTPQTMADLLEFIASADASSPGK